MKIIEQAIRDYLTLDQSNPLWPTAYSFLFSNSHYIQWGDMELNLSDIGDFIDIEVEWLRRKIREKESTCTNLNHTTQ